jgi:hypothetical protein
MISDRKWPERGKGEEGTQKNVSLISAALGRSDQVQSRSLTGWRQLRSPKLTLGSRCTSICGNPEESTEAETTAAPRRPDRHGNAQTTGKAASLRSSSTPAAAGISGIPTLVLRI